MELKFFQDYEYTTCKILLIAPLMELKYNIGINDFADQRPFNRTAYGIEIRLDGGLSILVHNF